jgi:methylphosphotriester-DNA--protein-cysteine methyltransferase
MLRTMTRESTEVSGAAWEAVSKRDRHFDGSFVYIATTTGIYCRPSCPARHPHRRNSLILPSAAEAEKRGYSACQRCHPGSESMSRAETGVKAALEYIGAHWDRSTTLGTLAQVSGLSPNHLQQAFKRIVGLSPKAFCDTRRMARLRQCLRRGQSVSNASYEAGFESRPLRDGGQEPRHDPGRLPSWRGRTPHPLLGDERHVGARAGCEHGKRNLHSAPGSNQPCLAPRSARRVSKGRFRRPRTLFGVARTSEILRTRGPTDLKAPA